MRRRLTVSAGVLLVAALATGLVVIAGRGRAPEVAAPNSRTTDPLPGSGVDAGTVVGHYNLAGLRIVPVVLGDQNPDSAAPVVFRLRRATRLSIAAYRAAGRDQRLLVPERPFAAGTHELTRAVIARAGLGAGAWFLEFVDRGPDDITRVFNPARHLEWTPRNDVRVTVEHGWSQLRYELTEPALLRMRVGLQPGLWLDTLVNGDHRGAGAHLERWTRADASDHVRYPASATLRGTIESAALPPNLLLVSVAVGASGTAVAGDLRSGRRLPQPVLAVRAATPAPSHRSSRRGWGDFRLAVAVRTGAANRPEPNAVTIAVQAPECLAGCRAAEDESLTIRVYIDSSPVHEAPGTLPFSLARRVDQLGAGPHIVTVVTEDQQGNAGMGTAVLQLRR